MPWLPSIHSGPEPVEGRTCFREHDSRETPGFFCELLRRHPYLAGYYNIDSLKSAREVGGLFESLVILHLKILAQLITPGPRFCYWRTVTGKEVDLVIEYGRKLVAVEVKLTSTPSYRDAEALQLFLGDYPETAAALLIHTGREIKLLHEKIVAIPWYLLSGKSQA